MDAVGKRGPVSTTCIVLARPGPCKALADSDVAIRGIERAVVWKAGPESGRLVGASLRPRSGMLEADLDAIRFH
jgi:hypothetical protein